ncbi:MAG TPA: hypothetical protein VEQ16_02510, partial [Acidocella sp.]|nr:hypothetical protein [Acidocella sp.]
SKRLKLLAQTKTWGRSALPSPHISGLYERLGARVAILKAAIITLQILKIRDFCGASSRSG